MSARTGVSYLKTLKGVDNRNFYIIIEAKRGWILPGYDQLKMYSERDSFITNPARHKAIVSMSECTEEYANNKLPKVDGVDILHLSWKNILDLAEEARKISGNAEKYVLDELKGYIGRIMTTQNKNTNWVYVVSLGMAKAEVTTEEGKVLAGDITYVDIVRKHNVYSCPIGGGKGGWPKEPLTYIGFRYDGKLQSIHHIESYVITDNLHPYIPELPDVTLSQTHFVYKLGPGIVPAKEVKTGKKIVMSNRVWAHIDALLTADTISEAMDISRARENVK